MEMDMDVDMDMDMDMDMGVDMDTDTDIDMDTDTDMDTVRDMDIDIPVLSKMHLFKDSDVEYRMMIYKKINPISNDVRLRHLQSNIGSSDIMLSAISFITDIGLCVTYSQEHKKLVMLDRMGHLLISGHWSDSVVNRFF